MKRVIQNLDLIIGLTIFMFLFIGVMGCGIHVFQMYYKWNHVSGQINRVYKDGNKTYREYSWEINGHKYTAQKQGISLPEGDTIIIVNPQKHNEGIPVNDLHLIIKSTVLIFITFVILVILGIIGVKEKRKILERSESDES